MSGDNAAGQRGVDPRSRQGGTYIWFIIWNHRRTLAQRTALIPKRAFKSGGLAGRSSASWGGAALKEAPAKTWLACRIGTCEPRDRAREANVEIWGRGTEKGASGNTWTAERIRGCNFTLSVHWGALEGCIGYNMEWGVCV